MGLLAQLDEPFFAGQLGTSSEVPGTFDVAIHAHPYMTDTEFIFGRRDAFRHQSIASQRSASDITTQPGEATINPQGLWRSEFQDWSLGSGQLFYDREHSQPNRFHHSQGVDPFTQKGYLGVTPDTTLVFADTDPTCQILVVNGYIYKANASGVTFQAANTFPFGFQGVVAGLSGTPVMMASDGNNVYIACGSGGVYMTTAGSGAGATHLVNVGGQDVTFIAYCANTLLVGNANSLYQITGTTTVWPTALIAQPEATWLWNCACAGDGWIYVGGYAGGTQDIASVSAIYKTQIAGDGTTLNVPTLATPLPPGETVYSLFAFVNYILMGTNLGVRFCQTLGLINPSGQDTGLLKLGPIVPNLQEAMQYPCRCFTANQRFVYFGWSYASFSYGTQDGKDYTGVGWLDISAFTGEQTPAYSAFAMAQADGEITSMDLYPGNPALPIFVVAGVGIYLADGTAPLSWFQTGFIAFRLPDKKQLIAASVDITPNDGQLAMTVRVDDTTDVNLGMINGSGLFDVPAGTEGELFEATVFLSTETSDQGTAAIRRTTLQAYPEIAAGTSFIVALEFFDSVSTRAGTRRDQRVYDELAFLENLHQTQLPVVYQEGSASWLVVVDDIDMVWYKRSKLPFGGFQGVCVVTMKTATSGLIT